MRFYALAQRPWIEEADGSGHWGLPPGTIGAVDLAPVGAQTHVFVTSDAPFDPGDVAAIFGDGTRLDSHVPTAAEATVWENLVGVAVQPGWTLLDLLWHTLTDQADPDGVTRAKPIMPTHGGVLELHLGGHSLLRAEKLPADPTTHLAWPNIQRVLQNDYRAIQGRDRVLARKWLGAQQLKYRLTPERARDLLIPADLPRELPLKPTTTLADDFNRADGTLHNSEATVGGVAQGWVWTTLSIGYDIVSNRAESTAIGTNWSVTGALSSADNEAQALSAPRNPGVSARASDSELTAYTARLASAGGGALGKLTRMVDGVGTDIADIGSTSSNAVVYCKADGSSITGRIGATEVTITDTGITSGLRTGLVSAGTGRSHDDFEAADLVAEPALVSVRSEAMEIGEAPMPIRERTRAHIEGLDVGQVVKRLRGIARRRDEAVGLTQMSTFARTLSRLRAEAVGMTESTMSKVEAIAEALVRILAEAVAMAEAVARPRGLARVRAELVGMAGALARVGGFVSAAVPAITSRIRMRVDPSTRMNVPPARR